jgi:hypothetical protein
LSPRREQRIEALAGLCEIVRDQGLVAMLEMLPTALRSQAEAAKPESGVEYDALRELADGIESMTLYKALVEARRPR